MRRSENLTTALKFLSKDRILPFFPDRALVSLGRPRSRTGERCAKRSGTCWSTRGRISYRGSCANHPRSRSADCRTRVSLPEPVAKGVPRLLRIARSFKGSIEGSRDGACVPRFLFFVLELIKRRRERHPRDTRALRIIKVIGSSRLCRKERTFQIFCNSCSFGRFARRPAQTSEPLQCSRRSPQLEEATTC
ncbi:hypothetical protein ABIF63_001353 [Bradyrhizobium japonicum]|uniref:Uncharacterized protein n=1 Tax=Bradyrhizobium japonicum TaxID=375 RepID=A0ABV2RKE0_BRAJP